MMDKLRAADARYDELNNKLSDPSVISDNELYRQLMKEYKNLTPIIEKFREYKYGKLGLTVYRKTEGDEE